MASLYDIALTVIAQNLRTNSACSQYKYYLPERLQLDVIVKIREIGHYTVLATEIQQRETLKMLLRVDRMKFHSVFQRLMECGCNTAEYHANEIESHKDLFYKSSEPDYNTKVEEFVQFSLTLGEFLREAGWYRYAERIYTTTLKVIQSQSDECSIIAALNCCGKLLRVQNAYCCYSEAAAMVECVVDMRKELSQEAGEKFNKAAIYNEIAVLLYAQSHYDQAFKHSLYALGELRKPDTPICTMIDVMRLCSKGCVIKREFKVAERLIKQAVQIVYKYFGDQHIKYADTIGDYGFYLLNIDQVASAVDMYKKALEIRKKVFGGKNLRIAISHEELAYALYVHEYNSGSFEPALKHAGKAMFMLQLVLPRDHLLMASSKRVQALILEEIAIDDDSGRMDELLNQALTLHKYSLNLAKKTFGEYNLQTAKHYGNLGRLYQTLQMWQKAETMHKRAIEIKESLLGLEDFEVALSVGHLASLYAYDLNRHTEAEVLYKRSIEINIKLFGRGYSGLMYDYKGLLRIYTLTHKDTLVVHYNKVLLEWEEIRENQVKAEHNRNPLEFLNTKITLAHLIDNNLDYLLEQNPELFCQISEKESLLNNFVLSESWSRPVDTMVGLEDLEN